MEFEKDTTKLQMYFWLHAFWTTQVEVDARTLWPADSIII